MNTSEENNVLESNFSCGRWDLTKEENDLQESIGFWVQSIASLVIGSFGILVNMVTIVVLSTADLRKLFFNKLLIVLTMFDNLFLVNSLYESVRLHIIKTDYCALQGHLLIFLRPFRHISMCCSIYMTLVLTFERYLAVVRPIRHRNRFIGSSHVKRLIKYVSPVIIFSIIFCLPEFLELELVYVDNVNMTNDEDMYTDYTYYYTDDVELNGTQFALNLNDSFITPLDNNTNALATPFENTTDNFDTLHCLQPTELSLSNRYYVLWYKNIAMLFITGIFPFCLLAYFNLKIHQTTKSALQTRGELSLTVQYSGANTANAAISHNTGLTSSTNGLSHRVLSQHNSIAISEGGEDPITSQNNQCKEQKSEEHSQATVLLGIVIAFFLCHILRILLNIEETVTFEELNRIRDEAAKFNKICSGVPLSTMIANDVSHLLLQVNSSITFFIYISFSSHFKDASKSIFLGIARYLHFYCRETRLDRFNEVGDFGTEGKYRNNSSINTRTTSLLNTPTTTFRRERSRNKSSKLSRQAKEQHEDGDEVIIQTNNYSSVQEAQFQMAIFDNVNRRENGQKVEIQEHPR